MIQGWLGFFHQERVLVQLRLSILMFLQFALPGAMLPLYSMRLKELGFSPMEMAFCCATHGIGALLAPLGAQLADRYFSAEKCVAVFSLSSSVFLVGLAYAESLYLVFLLTLLFWLLTVPMMVLCSTICFIHLKDPERQFGIVRLSGTIGWMLPGWILLILIRVFSNNNLQGIASEQFLIGSVFGVIVAVYSLTLPSTPPSPSKIDKFAPFAALKLLKGWPFATYCLCTLGVCITQPFTTQATPLLLEYLGIVQPWLSPTLTISQISEVLSLFLLPMFLLRLGLRGSMLFGLICWTIALGILSIGQPLGLVVPSLALNGLSVTGFLVTGQVYVNMQAKGDLKASVQSLLTFVQGIGLVLGHILVGLLRSSSQNASNMREELVLAFQVAAVINGLLCVIFFCCFKPVFGKKA
ncbi:MAG: hypothetical protein RL179_1384 [Planctomycetota bacterium]